MKNRTQLSMSEARKHYSVCMAHRSRGGSGGNVHRSHPLASAFSCMADRQTAAQQQRQALLAASRQASDTQDLTGALAAAADDARRKEG